MSTEAPSALRADACPDPEQLAAFIDGTLTPVERTQVETHLLSCADCRDVVGASVEVLSTIEPKAAPAPAPVSVPAPVRIPAEVVPMPQGRRSRAGWWVGAAAALAAAAAILFAVRVQQPSSYYVPEMAELVAVRTDTRPTEARLAGGFAYAPPPPITRGAPEARNLELTATAEKVRNAIGDRRGAEADAARGVSSLIADDIDGAIQSLERATEANSATARMFSDLAAAYLQRGRPEDLARALSSAERALAADGALREASFNRALALERLARNAEALQAWRDYVARETDSQWAAEASRHVSRLSAGS